MKDIKFARMGSRSKQRRHEREMLEMRQGKLTRTEAKPKQEEPSKCIKCWNYGKHQRCNGKGNCDAVF
jgi:hypothetical protein